MLVCAHRVRIETCAYLYCLFSFEHSIILLDGEDTLLSDFLIIEFPIALMVIQIGYGNIDVFRVTPFWLRDYLAFEVHDGWLECKLRLNSLTQYDWVVRQLNFTILYCHRYLYLVFAYLLRVVF